MSVSAARQQCSTANEQLSTVYGHLLVDGGTVNRYLWGERALINVHLQSE